MSVAWAIWAVTFAFEDRPEPSSAENVAANFLCSIVYGLALAYVYRWIGPREA